MEIEIVGTVWFLFFFVKNEGGKTMLKHAEYFQKNNSLMTVYGFIKKMIDNYFAA